MSRAMQLKANIKNIALQNHVSAQAVLQDFMLERLLERISLSKFKTKVILKGGMLIASIVGINNRTTMDMDATLIGYPLTEEFIQSAFTEICAIQLDDEVTFDCGHAVAIREDDFYGGFRVAIIARFDSIVVPLKIDITTGDKITPGAIRYSYRSNFENKDIEIWAYNVETILAEKIETILRRSVFNTRPRDFYDIFIIVRTFGHIINRNILATALFATTSNRASFMALENRNQILLTIKSDQIMRQRWDRYCMEYYYANGIKFDEMFDVLVDIVESAMQ